MSIQKSSRAISAYANGKVMKLQSGYLAGLSSSRASLARLRRLGTSRDTSWMSIGDDLFEGFPELGAYEEEKGLNSVKAALRYYAMLQQSKSVPVAVLQKDAKRSVSFGSACRAISLENNGSGAPGVRRRMAMVEAANDFGGVQTAMRSLVQLMRASKGVIQLDFGRLASDLFQIQFDETRSAVFMRWAQDYYRAANGNKATAEDAEE
ncbi:type I-E CRISPR-associated protein Cse2/CasB [Parafannyhessea umbonata]|uniref:CRISPR system Cascade subunit CasB n=1 Tax=Parafannyhessea umbonata TaxID=604330 RepID=A0A1G6NIJ9_9ACTN|nr:type I-E CRISPR-associated protein Cse2/CasB [Parafannyhessea umbonata]MDD7199484.1 type I-E CRISPR-associated protein Cse2/CasB [Parafannyhessea umbonata]SDC67147.1 CRISPR system Cascade subunit CasB [Parafannyhessea umbonata]